MTTEIVKNNTQLPVNSLSDLSIIGTELAKSGMLGITSPAAGLVVAMTCHMEGITPLEFARTYHIIGNKPSKKADTMAAEYRQRGGKYKIVERSGTRAAALFTFEGQEVPFEFTMEMAIKAELAGKGNVNWNKYPENMLWARMMSNAIRVLCPEVNAGIYTPEENEDFNDEPKNVTPVAVDPSVVARAVNAEVVEPIRTVEFDYCPVAYNGAEPNALLWTAIASEDLQMILNGRVVDPAITPSHLEVIESVLTSRKETF